MADKTLTYREEICRVGKLLYDKGLIAGTEGNISYRLPAGEILITPAGICKGMMNPADLVRIDHNGKPQSKSHRPSSEYRIHLLAYEKRPEINAVVHSHPSYATGFALAGTVIDASGLPEFEVSFGAIPFVPFATPGTTELSDALAKHIGSGCVYLLENHGLVALGTTLLEAFFRTEMAEHCAKALYLAYQIDLALEMNVEYDEDSTAADENSLTAITMPRDRRRREN